MFCQFHCSSSCCRILILAAPSDNLVVEMKEYIPRVDCYTSGAEGPDMASCLVALQSMPASRGEEVFSKNPTISQIRIPRRIPNRKFCHTSFCPSNQPFVPTPLLTSG